MTEGSEGYEDLVGCKVQLDFTKLIEILKQNSLSTKDSSETIKSLQQELQLVKQTNIELSKKVEKNTIDIEQTTVFLHDLMCCRFRSRITAQNC